MPTICFVKRWGVVLQVEKKKELEVEKTGNKEYYAPPPKKNQCHCYQIEEHGNFKMC